MTINETINSERLTTSLQKCQIHVQRLHYALSPSLVRDCIAFLTKQHIHNNIEIQNNTRDAIARERGTGCTDAKREVGRSGDRLLSKRNEMVCN